MGRAIPRMGSRLGRPRNADEHGAGRDLLFCASERLAFAANNGWTMHLRVFGQIKFNPTGAHRVRAALDVLRIVDPAAGNNNSPETGSSKLHSTAAPTSSLKTRPAQTKYLPHDTRVRT